MDALNSTMPTTLGLLLQKNKDKLTLFENQNELVALCLYFKIIKLKEKTTLIYF